MGIVNSYSYKNVFVSDEENRILNVYMNSILIDKYLLKMEANKNTVDNISIIAGELSQSNFVSLIDNIKVSTDKRTCISFIPIIVADETPIDAYQRYVEAYKSKNKDDIIHFPDNIFVNQTFVESDQIEERYIKNNLLKK